MDKPEKDIKPTRWGEKKPPHLRVSAGANSCAVCTNFGHIAGRAWEKAGMCRAHGEPVQEEFVCADFESVAE